MVDIRPVILFVGAMLLGLAACMILPAFVGIYFGNEDWKIFMLSAGLTCFVGGGLVLTQHNTKRSLSTKQAFMLTGLSWIVLAGFSALPFQLSSLQLPYVDGFFEAMSGLTTTGATVLTHLDETPPSILLWRALLQWFGGIGIIVTAIAFLPLLQIGGMQLFRLESSDPSQKILPNATSIAKWIGGIYCALTFLCMVAYMLAGMDAFDAWAHAMTTLATGGFSTKDASLGHFDNALIDWVGIVFMCLASLPFMLYVKGLKGHPSFLLKDSQVHWFFIILISFVIIIGLVHSYSLDTPSAQIWREASFNVTSILTGTGYVNANYDGWGHMALTLFFVMAFLGGCAGSTCCGLKIFRLQIIQKIMTKHIYHLIYPKAVYVMRYNKKPLLDEVANSVVRFTICFFICFFLIALALSLLGLDHLTALSAAASAIGNVGPGLGEIVGPSGNYASLPNMAKWILGFGMLLGRLELFAILVLLNPRFWIR